MSRAKMRRFSTGLRLGSAVMLLAIGIFGAEGVVDTWRRDAGNQQREGLMLQLAEYRGRLESAVSSTVYLASGLIGFVRSVPDPSPVQVRTALGAIYESDDRIRNLGLAPANILRFIYPLEGNEAALGLVYEEQAEQWPDVLRAIESRRPVLAGPVKLVQGGRAIINRTPVFLDDGQYWGLISIVIDLDALLASVGLSAGGARTTVGIFAGPGADQIDAWLLGDQDVLARDPVSMSVNVPGESWTMLTAPAGGWDDFSGQVLALRLLLYSVLLGGVAFLLSLAEGRARAREMAKELTQLNAKLATSNDALEYLSRYDALTNVANRRYFDDHYPNIWAQCRRNKLPLSVLMVDVDHFKSINDRYGHQVGDVCLQRVAGLISSSLQREEDFVARYGGEEFIVVGAGLNDVQASALGDKIRRHISGTLIDPDAARIEPFRMTASVGVSTALELEGIEPADLCRAADAALYEAKHAGRNCVRQQAPRKSS